MDLIPIFFSIASILTVSILIISLFQSKKKKNTPPHAAGAWPVVGHLPIYAGKKPVHVIFGAMVDTYGPVFTTRAGSRTTLIISSQEIAKECYTIHDKVLDRPRITASKLLGYNDSFLTFAPYGPYWREIRKTVAREILTNQQIDMLKHFREREADVSFKVLCVKWEGKGTPKDGAVVDMKEQFHDLVNNIALMTFARRRYYGDSPNSDIEEARKFQKLTRYTKHLFGLYLFSDFAPSLAWLDYGIKKQMEKTGKEMDKIVEGWVAEHKEKRQFEQKESEKDFLDLLLDAFEGIQVPGFDAHTAAKAICVDLISAWTETTVVILTWALSLLLNNPQVLRKTQEELDNHVCKTRIVEESDIKDLVYLQAVVKETLRLYPPVPLSAFRSAIEDFDISSGNYHVPTGTQLLVNVWKIQRDPHLWHNPERFEPERFFMADKEVDVGGQSFRFMPFGLGRRSCPAANLGLRTVHYLLARFLHSFEVAKPSNEDVDMTESNGLVNLKATPLEVKIIPRLDLNIY